MEEIVSLPPMEFFNNDFQLVLDFIESLGNPKYKIAGDVNIFNSNITSLGNLVEVGGKLDIRYVPITSLPDNLTVGGCLDLNWTNIKSLPNNLTVGRFLKLYNTPLSEKYSEEDIRKMIENKGGFVKGDIYI